MTPRQVFSLLEIINHADLMAHYNSSLSYRMAEQEKFPTLDEFLNLALENKTSAKSAFDEKTDAVMEEMALKHLKERQAQYGR